MAGGGNHHSGGGTPTPTVGTDAGYSWNGFKSPDSFDAKKFGTGVASDLNNWYHSPLQTNPIADFTDFTQGTKNLIGQGIQQAGNIAGNTTLQNMASGSMLGNGNPYLNGALDTTRKNILTDLGSQFTDSGRFGGGSYIDTATNSLANAENTARFGQYQNDINNMYGAQSALNNATATGLGYSNLNDQKAQELNASNQKMWDLQNNAPYQRITQALGALQGTNGQTNTPLNLMDILGTGANVAGSLLPLLGLLG